MNQGLISIGNQAFYGCTNIENITLPNSLETLGERVFRDCVFTSITYQGTKAEWEAIEKEFWNDTSSIQNVVCTDGTITL